MIDDRTRCVELPHALLAPAVPSSTRDLADFARAVSESPDVATARRTVVRRAGELTRSSSAALTRRGAPRSVVFVASWGDAAREIGRVAERAGEGVCWQVHADGLPVVCPDLTREDRWPSYCRAALRQASVRSVVGLPLRYCGDLLGALVLYSARPDDFDPQRLTDALALADHAALALAHAAARVKIDNLEVALRTNREIAIAIGIVMDRLHLPEEQAFDHLRQVSEGRHVKLRDIAARIALTGEIPAARPVP